MENKDLQSGKAISNSSLLITNCNKRFQVELHIKTAGQRLLRHVNLPNNLKAVLGISVSQWSCMDDSALANDGVRFVGADLPGKITDKPFIAGLIASLKAIPWTPGKTSIPITAANGQKIYYGHAQKHGVRPMTINGFEGGFLGPVTVNITDPVSGKALDYLVWETTNISLGDTLLVIDPYLP